MKIIVTGSLGHISKPLTEELVQKGHEVTVVSSNPERQKEIEKIGATAAIGTVTDGNFLTDTFAGADAVYTMVRLISGLRIKFDFMCFKYLWPNLFLTG